MARGVGTAGTVGSVGPLGSVGIVGGTGALGRGLAARLALAGVRVRLGSRDPSRADASAAALRARLGRGEISGAANRDVLDADVVVLAVPFHGVDEVLAPLAAGLVGRVVVSAVNPMVVEAGVPRMLGVEAGSAAEHVATRLEGARVTAAFNTVSSRQLLALDEPVGDDVLVVGDDAAAVDTVVRLADRIEGCRGVAAGPLALAGSLEAITPLLIMVNRRHGCHAGLRVTRLPVAAPASAPT
jgi:8-hydroxy-5-deazaflavin:NADPH oxidoreductase